MGRIKKTGIIHPVTKVTIYDDGTCNAPVAYDRRGYKVYVAQIGRKVKVFSLHRHVAQLFIPNPCRKPYVNHKDGKKYNAKASNLEWVTASENSRHAHRIGLNKKKLTAKDVREIRRSKIKSYRICFKYDVSEAHIVNIRKRKSWKHIP